METPITTIEKEIESLGDFRTRIDHAKLTGEQWVETSQQIIDFFMKKKSLGDAGYFIYDGIFVCPTGTTEECQRRMEQRAQKELYKIEGLG